MSTGPFRELRGKELPPDPIDRQVFFLDVPNDSDPPRGWYQCEVSLTGATVWNYIALSMTDQGDLVRPKETLNKQLRGRS